MARSENLNAAMDKLLASLGSETVGMKAIENAVQTMMHEFDGCFMPFRNMEVPIIIAALGLLEKSLRGQFPEPAKFADKIMEFFTVVGAVKKVGGISDGR